MISYEQIKSIHVEGSSHCNASCPVCPRNYHGGEAFNWFEKKHFTLEEHQRFFNPEFARQLQVVLYCGNLGDPSLNPELVEICKWWLSHNPNLALQINTNSGTRDEHFWGALGKALRGTYGNVTFSVDGLEDTNHIYRRGVVWDRVMRAMTSYIEAGGPAVWEFLVFKHNQHQVEEARQLADKLGFQNFYAKKAMGFGGAVGAQAIPVLKRDGEFDYHILPADDESLRNGGTKWGGDVNFYKPEPKAQSSLADSAPSESLTVPQDMKTRFEECEIECHSVKTSQVYISSEGLVYPCCFIGSREYAPNRWNFVNKQIQEFLSSVGKKRYSLHERSLKEIINDPWMQKDLVESWQIPTLKEGRLAVCSEFCGTGLTEMKEATSHRNKSS